MATQQQRASGQQQRAAPLFSAAPGTSEKVSINLDDIFADCFFSQDGTDVNIMGDLSGGSPMPAPSLMGGSAQSNQNYIKTESSVRSTSSIGGGGTDTYNAQQPLAAPNASSIKQERPQISGQLTSDYPHGPPTGLEEARTKEEFAEKHAYNSGKGSHDDFGMEDDFDEYDDDDLGNTAGDTANRRGGGRRSGGTGNKSTKRSRTSAREMTEQQKDERRERNREHAKRSRVRKKFLLESLQQSVNALQYENDKLRLAIRDKVGEEVANDLLAKVQHADTSSNDQSATPDALPLPTTANTQKQSGSHTLIAKSPSDATRILDDPDYSLVKALQTAQQNFVITDPSLPDNPIVFASQGFLNLTGYSLDNVLGRNCRFLQGPRTDPRAVAKIRKAVEQGYDTSVCLLNYRIDGSTFYNQFFVAPLRDGDGNVVNYVGVQCQVSDAFAQAIARDEQLPPL